MHFSQKIERGRVINLPPPRLPPTRPVRGDRRLDAGGWERVQQGPSGMVDSDVRYGFGLAWFLLRVRVRADGMYEGGGIVQMIVELVHPYH